MPRPKPSKRISASRPPRPRRRRPPPVPNRATRRQTHPTRTRTPFGQRPRRTTTRTTPLHGRAIERSGLCCRACSL
eukprot:908523-Rhodomonas_salina.1